MSDTPSLRLVVLVSGSGTLLQSVLDAVADGLPIEVCAVGADRDAITGLDRARAAGIPTFVVPLGSHPDRDSWDRALAETIGAHRPDLVLSAGFMKILGPAVLASHRVINTHPALLPSFPGAHGVRDALRHGVKVTGCTIHEVDAGVDTGPILAQRAVEIADGDTEDTLHERIKVAERELLVELLRREAGGRGPAPARPASSGRSPRPRG